MTSHNLLGNAIFQAFGGGGASQYKNQLAGALAAARIGSSNSTARFNNLKADSQATMNTGHQAVLDQYGMDTPQGFAARQQNPQFKQSAEGVSEIYDLDQKKLGLAALLKSNPDIANQFRAGMSGPDIRSLGMMAGDTNLSAANVGVANANAGAFDKQGLAYDALGNQRQAGADQITQKTEISKQGMDAIMNNTNIPPAVKSLLQMLQTDQTGSGLAAVMQIPGVAELLKQQGLTEESIQDLNVDKGKTEGKKGDLLDDKGDVQKELKKKVTSETAWFDKKIEVLTASIENWDAKTRSVEANMENFNAKVIAQIKEINSRTNLHDQQKLVMVEQVKKVQAATGLFLARATALFKGNALSQNQFMKDAVKIYTEAMDNDTPVGVHEGGERNGQPKYLSEYTLEEQMQIIATESVKFRDMLFGGQAAPAPAPAQNPAPNPLASALGGGGAKPQNFDGMNLQEMLAIANQPG